MNNLQVFRHFFSEICRSNLKNLNGIYLENLPLGLGTYTVLKRKMPKSQISCKFDRYLGFLCYPSNDLATRESVISGQLFRPYPFIIIISE